MSKFFAIAATVVFVSACAGKFHEKLHADHEKLEADHKQ